MQLILPAALISLIHKYHILNILMAALLALAASKWCVSEQCVVGTSKQLLKTYTHFPCQRGGKVVKLPEFILSSFVGADWHCWFLNCRA